LPTRAIEQKYTSTTGTSSIVDFGLDLKSSEDIGSSLMGRKNSMFVVSKA